MWVNDEANEVDPVAGELLDAGSVQRGGARPCIDFGLDRSLVESRQADPFSPPDGGLLRWYGPSRWAHGEALDAEGNQIRKVTSPGSTG